MFPGFFLQYAFKDNKKHGVLYQLGCVQTFERMFKAGILAAA
jgi:hypothetical protein